MDNNYQINVVNVDRGACGSKDHSEVAHKGYSVKLIPTRMLTMHPYLFSSMILSLAADPVSRVFHTCISDLDYNRNGQQDSLLSVHYNDIFPINLFSKQKKEVNDIKITQKHCKTFQYKMRFLPELKFFNN